MICFFIRQIDLRAIQQMQHHRLMLAIAQMLQSTQQFAGVDPEIADQHHQASPGKPFGESVHLVGQVGFLPCRDRLERALNNRSR